MDKKQNELLKKMDSTSTQLNLLVIQPANQMVYSTDIDHFKEIFALFESINKIVLKSKLCLNL